jgi:Tol biopolymer transport system component
MLMLIAVVTAGLGLESGPASATSVPKTRLVSVSATGTVGNNSSYYPSISADGRFVAFQSDASNLVANDTNASTDVFVYDRSTRKTRRVSVSSSGVQGNGGSVESSISPDGRFVAFTSNASNLVGKDINATSDVFVYDRSTRKTRRVSVSSRGAEGNDSSYLPAVSGGGRFVAFTSNATNLVGGDTNDREDVFVYERSTRKTRRVSISSAGAQGDGFSDIASVSRSGRFVAFYSAASNLVAKDTNANPDVFVHDRSTRKTRRVSVSSSGAQGNGSSYEASISADGRFVAFHSGSSNLVGNDTNATNDVFVHDRSTRKTRRVSVNSGGVQGNEYSEGPSISADGRFVAFYSYASNFVGNDTNTTTDVFIRGPRR